MSKKKIWQGLLIYCIIIIVCLGTSSVKASVSEGQFNASKVELDLRNQKMIVNDTSNTEIIFGISTVNKKTGGKIINTPSWEVYENINGGVVIDLSSLNRIKENYIQVKGDRDTIPLTIKIPAVNKDLKAVFMPLTGKVSIKNKKNQEPNIPNGTEFEYRTQYSGWQPFEITDDLAIYQQRGAVLYFRTKAPDVQKLDDNFDTEKLKDGDGNEIAVKCTGSFPGIEMKVKVGKVANAPKISINYTKRTITIPKGILYRIYEKGINVLPEWTYTSQKLILRDQNLLVQSLVNNGGILESMTKKNDKKPASRICRLEVDGQEKLDVSETENGETVLRDVDGMGVQSAVEKSVKKGKITYTLTLSNQTVHQYQVVLQDSSAVPGFAAAKPKTIAAAKAGKTKNTKIKGVKEGQYIFIRKKGNNKSKTWTTDYISFGQIGKNAEGSQDSGTVNGLSYTYKLIVNNTHKEYFDITWFGWYASNHVWNNINEQITLVAPNGTSVQGKKIDTDSLITAMIDKGMEISKNDKIKLYFEYDGTDHGKFGKASSLYALNLNTNKKIKISENIMDGKAGDTDGEFVHLGRSSNCNTQWLYWKRMEDLAGKGEDYTFGTLAVKFVKGVDVPLSAWLDVVNNADNLYMLIDFS